MRHHAPWPARHAWWRHDRPPRPRPQLGHRNLIAFNRALTRWGSRGALEEGGGAVLCAGGTWIPVVANGAFRSDDSLDGAELVARADAFFAGLARGFTVKVRDSGEDDDLRRACEAAGLEPFGEPVPEMLCRSPLPDPPPVDGVDAALVDDEAGVRDFIAVNAEAYGTYGMPAEVLSDLFDETERLLEDPAASIVVARRGAEPVATAMAYESDGVASLQWVGTVPAARGAGLGALVTVAATNLAFEHGASSCTLQASPMGEPVYRRLGYETIYHYEEYVRWPRPPGALTSSAVASVGLSRRGAPDVGGLADVLQAVVGDADEAHAQGDRGDPSGGRRRGRDRRARGPRAWSSCGRRPRRGSRGGRRALGPHGTHVLVGVAVAGVGGIGHRGRQRRAQSPPTQICSVPSSSETWWSCTRVRCQTSHPMVLAPGAGARHSCSRSRPSTASAARGGIRP